MNGWSYYTIPTVVAGTNLVMFASMGAHLDPRLSTFCVIMINFYMFGLSTLSGKREKFMLVFLPWVFLPVTMNLSFGIIGNIGVGILIIFLTTVLVEYSVFKDFSLVVFILRSVATFFAFWGLKEWLRDLLISYIAR